MQRENEREREQEEARRHRREEPEKEHHILRNTEETYRNEKDQERRNHRAGNDKERGESYGRKEYDPKGRKFQKEKNTQRHKGYMSSLGKPRQPRTTQENRDKTLR